MDWVTKVSGLGSLMSKRLLCSTQANSVAHPASYQRSTKASFRGSKVIVGVKLITRFYLVPRLIVCGSIPALHHTSSWHGVPHFIHKVPLHDVKVGICYALNARRIRDPVFCAEILREAQCRYCERVSNLQSRDVAAADHALSMYS